MIYFYKDKDWYYFGIKSSNNFKQLIPILKGMGCAYNTENKEWYVKSKGKVQLILDFIKDWDIKEVNPNEIERKSGIVLKSIPDMVSREELKQLIPELGLKGYQPREYQLDALIYTISHKNCINGCSPGLGKTFCSILHCEILDLFPCLIIAPNSVKSGWLKEWKQINPNRSVSVISTGNKKNDFSADVLIINYDILGQKQNKKVEIRYKDILKQYKIIVVDEIHFLKNENSIRSKAFKKISKDCDSILGLSGTLIMNRPFELLNIISLIKRENDIAPDKWKFLRRYCNARQEGKFGWDFKGAANIKELHRLISNYCYFRVEKRDVLKELPSLTEEKVECDLKNKSKYESAEKDFIQFLIDNKEDEDKIDKALRAEHLVKMNALKQLSLECKIDSIKEWIREFLEANEEEKLVVFGVMTQPLEQLFSSFKESVLITGTVLQKKKEKLLEQFKTQKDCRILFANIQCIGTGVDGLQHVCSNMALIEFPQRPSDLEQVISRLDRSGQTNPVIVYYLLSKDTIDSQLWEMLKSKKEVTNIVNKGFDDDTSLMLIGAFKEKEFSVVSEI